MIDESWLRVAGVHVISLPHRADRRARLALQWPYPSVPVRFHDGVYAATPSLGCLAAHLEVLAAADGPALVLEDDAVFADAFTLSLRPPGDWQVLWLGRQLLAPGIDVDDTWQRPRRIARTHAYVARDPRRLAELLEAAAPPNIDPALSLLRVPQYMLRTATVGQGAGHSDITGATRAADEFWNP